MAAPHTGESTRLSAKSIERWFYLARAEEPPIEALAPKVPSHAGSHPSVAGVVAEELRELRRAHPRWSYQLVYDKLVAIARDKPQLGILPSYSTVCRYMKHHGLGKHRKPRRHEQQEPGFVPRERRSFEVSHVHALWHCDFHKAKRKVMTQSGEWRKALRLARRSLPRLLSRPVVPRRRGHRELRSRPLPGASEARPASLPAQR